MRALRWRPERGGRGRISPADGLYSADFDVAGIDDAPQEFSAGRRHVSGGHQAAAIAEHAAVSLPRLSVIVPVRNDPRNLARCLEALVAARREGDEIIVVDDASTDETPEVARGFEVELLRLDSRRGPAAARNRGAHAARNPLLFFVDADVEVRADTLEQVSRRAIGEPPVDAFFGSYNADPGAPNLVSQYRNLLHHFVHQSGNEEAFSFWSGCGAIDRSVFLDLGGFDAGYANASIEDIELGSRLARAAHPIALVKRIQVKHWKRWTLGRMVHCDIFKRGIPWTSLILRQGAMPNDLNLRHGQRLSALFAVGLLLTLTVGAFFHPSLVAIPLATLGTLLAADRLTLRGTTPRWVLAATGLGLVVAIAFLLVATPIGRGLLQPWSLAALLLALGIVVLNLPFYRFLTTAKGPVFALLSLPLHVIYYLCGSFAFGVGVLMHWTTRNRP